MARDIILAVDVPTDADTAFTAITTQEGQAAFWTTDCDVSPTEARFGLPGWDGSVIEWELGEPQGEDGTSVVLRHLGLHGPFGESDVALGNVAHTWAMILDRLQTYLRHDQPVPYFE